MTRSNQTQKDSGIKAVIFDIGGVLLLGDKEVKYGHQNINVHEEMSKKYGLGLKEWFDTIEDAYKKAITGKWKKDKVYGKLAKTLNTDAKKLEKEFIDAHRKYFRKNKGLTKFARKLRDDYYVGILSDQTPASKKVFLDKLKLENFEPVVISCDVGSRKPDKEIYKMVKKELDNLVKKDEKQPHKKIKYDEILFIDNRDWNLKPARELGMRTLLFKTNKQAIKDLKNMLKLK